MTRAKTATASDDPGDFVDLVMDPYSVIAIDGFTGREMRAGTPFLGSLGAERGRPGDEGVQGREANYEDNVTIFDQIAQGKADLMMTDAIETRLQANLHPELCAIHPDQPFNFSEKAVLLPKDMDLKLFVDQWLRQLKESGTFDQQLKHWLDYDWPQKAG